MKRKWVWLIEVLAAMTVFVIAFVSIMWSIQNTHQTFASKVWDITNTNTYNRIYAHLYSFKKNYWSIEFKEWLVWDTDCSSIDNWKSNGSDVYGVCIIYPEDDGAWWMTFELTTPLFDWFAWTSDLDKAYFWTLTSEWNNFLREMNLPTSKQVLLSFKEYEDDEDVFSISIHIIDVWRVWTLWVEQEFTYEFDLL